MKGAVLAGAVAALLAAGAHAEPVRPTLDRAPEARYDLHGVVREYVDALTRNWLLKMPDANPALLEMFLDRDKQPHRNLLPWSGEFAGKYLTGAVQVHRLTRDPALKEYLARFVAKLVQMQDHDGYLGPFPQDNRLEGKGGTWDVWGHYHLMLGLLLWHEDTGDSQALQCAVKIGDLLCRKFLHAGRRMVDTGSVEMNHAAVHSLCLLYAATKSKPFLDLAHQIADEEFPDRRAGDYLRLGLTGREFYQSPKPRWEGLHSIQGIAGLFWITGDGRYRDAFGQLWWSMVKTDRHNNGGFSSGEQAQGNPYHQGAIETCCTVAWVAMSVDMLRLTGSSIVADELELSTLNQVLGFQHRSGKACTYNTPMDGVRRNSTREIGFQIRPGSEEINCCSANAPRGFGMISDWALMTDGHGLTVNWYGPSTMAAQVGGTVVVLKQETTYPGAGEILLQVSPERSWRFPLQLRIPFWSARTGVQVNGEDVPDVKPGAYLTVDREWRSGDTVRISLDMTLHYWVGEQECAGKSSIYRGPLLLVHETAEKNEFQAVFSPPWKHFGELKAVNEMGAFLEFTFEGTGIIWKGRRFDDAGHVQVMIDGKELAVVDQFGPGRNLPFSWEHHGLEAGRHTLRLTVLPQKHPDSKGHWINVVSLMPPGPAAPVFDAARMEGRVAPVTAGPPPLVMLEYDSTTGTKVRLRDYGTAGEEEVPYRSWLNVQSINPTPFSRNNPWRTGRPGERRGR